MDFYSQSFYMNHAYYVRDDQGRVYGPYEPDYLREKARQGKLPPSWHLSPDRRNWVPAAKVQNLFVNLEKALSASLPSDKKYRGLTRKEQVGLFIDKFVLNKEGFKEALPFVQNIRVWWARLTFPSNGFVIAEVTPAGIRHIKYDPAAERPLEINQQEVDERISRGIKRIDWGKWFFAALLLVWGAWSLKDFIAGFSVTWGTIKAILFACIAFTALVFRTKQTKVFVGYELNREAEGKLNEIKAAVDALRRCSKVWLFKVRLHDDVSRWKYNAGSLFTVSKLPVAIFNRPIPNVELNIRVSGIAYQDRAIYFLLEKLLVIDGGGVRYVEYKDFSVNSDVFEYVETENQVFSDSEVIDRRWRYINRDGSRDKRFKNNSECPVVRCGILNIVAGDMKIEMLANNPRVPQLFAQRFPRLR